MTRDAFEQLVGEEFPKAIPEKFRTMIHNVAFLIEDEPSQALRKQEGLGRNETLLGLYHGVPATARGDYYGVGGTLPDTITLFQKPIEENALAEGKDVRQVIRDTVWHEVAHHFGYDERQIRGREKRRSMRDKRMPGNV
ncbi:MAG: metallopeptidase family protein [Minisyncoccia bacterium]|jgi:predicted Zn-dependent protease with MMP-like domain